ncbi:MAG TPA: hypothetical protein VFI04_02015 [Gaiellaceae bacterium]|nr:hypothetical protein [Gaiellaceae bacterium]
MAEDVEKVARNNALFREANERIESAAADAEVGVDTPVPFICECSDRACTTVIRLSMDAYRRVRSNPRWFAHAPGHEESLDGAVQPLERHDAYVLVEKVGRAGEITQALAETKDSG